MEQRPGGPVRTTAGPTPGPGQGLTVVTVITVVLVGAGQLILGWFAMVVAQGNRTHPYADSGGPIVMIGALILFGWTPYPGLALWLSWTARASGALLLRASRMRTIAEAVGVRPLARWPGWLALQLLLAAAMALTWYQFLGDRKTLPPTPVFTFQLLVISAWTLTAAELLIRTRDAMVRRQHRR
ncbi:hypothetical protein HJ590_08780 [Naumannella sp. ID2617S]|nr:hypothetical protein [Naumannella sp. ID2617S]